MNQTFENVKYILSEDMDLKITPIEQERLLVAVDLLFSKSNLKMLLITEIEDNMVILNFIDIRYIEKEYSKTPKIESYFKKINDLNTKLKSGKFFMEFDKNNVQRISYRMSVMFENELSRKMYKRALFLSLKTINDQINKLLEG